MEDPRNDLPAVLNVLQEFERDSPELRIYATTIAERMEMDARQMLLALHHLKAQGFIRCGWGCWTTVK